MYSRLIAIFMLLTCSGCIISKPKHNLEFLEIENLNQISGTYKNKGEGEWAPTLSEILLGRNSIETISGQRNLQHSEIELIQVSTAGGNITVSAIKNECVVYSRLFILHRDFEIQDGKIQVSNHFHLLTEGAGDVILGPSYRKVEIGLDTDQNGKYRYTGGLAGLAFLIFPVAGYEKHDVRFERIFKDVVHNSCKSH